MPTINGRILGFVCKERHRQAVMNELHCYMLSLPGEPQVCKHFGCGRVLTIRERLFGEKCIDHSIENISRVGPEKKVKIKVSDEMLEMMIEAGIITRDCISEIKKF